MTILFGVKGEEPSARTATELSSRPERSVVEGPAVFLSIGEGTPFGSRAETPVNHFPGSEVLYAAHA